MPTLEDLSHPVQREVQASFKHFTGLYRKTKQSLHDRNSSAQGVAQTSRHTCRQNRGPAAKKSYKTKHVATFRPVCERR